jgi:DNA modification methylase
MSIADVLSGARSWTVSLGDSLEVLTTLPDCSIDAVVTDPPYGLEFMSVAWDTFGDGRKGGERVPNTWGDHGSKEHPRNGSEQARIQGKKNRAFQEFSAKWTCEVFRVLKPGAHVLAFGGARTYHRMACAIEDAGFEIRDSLHWIYGSGFPKSLDVSKTIDKSAGAERASRNQDDERKAATINFGMKNRCTVCGKPFFSGSPCACPRRDLEAVAEDAQRWQGWGSALKPAHEPIVLARKPLVGSIAANVLAHGTEALNIAACRVEGTWRPKGEQTGLARDKFFTRGEPTTIDKSPDDGGRWPSNVLLGEDAAEELDRQSGERPGMRVGELKRGSTTGNGLGYNGNEAQAAVVAVSGDDGGASRFFPIFKYEAKADRAERDAGLHALEARTFNRVNAGGLENDPRWAPTQVKNIHPTVKPVALMVWLCRLITPPGGVILDPFTGSGTTGIAALRCGFRFIGVEREPDYAEIARARIVGDNPMFNGEAAG